MSPCIGFASDLVAHPTTLPPFRYAWLEAPLAARLAYVRDVPNWCEADVWPAGRLFDMIGEYRWQRRADNTLHAVLLLDADTLPAPFSQPLTLTKIETRDAALILWGEWVKPQLDLQDNPDGGPRFYASELPRIQTYPLEFQDYEPAQASPRLLVWYYRDAQGTHGEFARCVDLVIRPSGEER